jgi:hypothetical protein
MAKSADAESNLRRSAYSLRSSIIFKAGKSQIPRHQSPSLFFSVRQLGDMIRKIEKKCNKKIVRENSARK